MPKFPGRRVLHPLLVVLTVATLPSPTVAQTPSPLPEWEYSAGIPLREYFEPKPPKWEITLGIGTQLQPKYDGASQYQFLPGPAIDVRYYDLAFLSTGEGLGINIFHGKNYRAGAAITYDLGRSNVSLFQPDGINRLRPIGGVAPGPEAKLFAEYVWFPVVFRADIRRALGGYDGWVGDLSMYVPVAGSQRFFLFVGPSLTFVDGHYMQNYFGVTPHQAQISGLPAFRASGGLKEISLGLSGTWFFYRNWFLNNSLAIDRLLNDAARSPTTRHKIQYAVGFTVGYDMR